MRQKSTLLHANTKKVDQPALSCSLTSTFVFPSCLLLNTIIRFQLVTVAEQLATFSFDMAHIFQNKEQSC